MQSTVEKTRAVRHETPVNGWLLKRYLLPAPESAEEDREKFEGVVSIIHQRRPVIKNLGIFIVSRLAAIHSIRNGTARSPADLHDKLQLLADHEPGEEAMRLIATRARAVPPQHGGRSRRDFIVLDFDDDSAATAATEIGEAESQLGLTNMPQVTPHLTVAHDYRRRAALVSDELNASGLFPFALWFGEPEVVPAVFRLDTTNDNEQAYIDAMGVTIPSS